MSSRTLTINGQQYDVGDVAVTTLLASFLRDQGLLGTHTTCYSGACGACTVVAAITDLNSGTKRTMTVNACLVPVLACLDWEITTIEGLGSKYKAYHVIEQRLTKYSGTQCGWCSPGMVMNMYGLSESKTSWTAEDVEHQLDGTMCRCTGYRPILDAFKSLTPIDIENAHKANQTGGCKSCPKSCCKKTQQKQQQEAGTVNVHRAPRKLRAGTWHQPTTLQELLDTLAGFPDGTSYTLVCGNTARALYGGSYTEYIYTAKIPELSAVHLTPLSLIFGANVSITRLIEQLTIASTTFKCFSYVAQLAETWKYVANTSVRNLASWAGNLATKVSHHEFPSDLFVGLLAAGATVTTVGSDGTCSQHSMEELLALDLVGSRRVIKKLCLLPHGDKVTVRTIKVRPRTTTALADVTAGFRFKVKAAKGHTVLDTPVIAYGGISSTFVRATATEAALVGQSLQDNGALQTALATLATEVVPDSQPAGTSPEYRVSLCQTLLYRTVLGIIGDTASSTVVSGGTDLQRPLSTGQQTFQQNVESWPVSEPVPKIEAPIQCSGEAQYITQLPTLPGELFGLFVTSTQANAHIASIDASAALAISGVVDFVSAVDIPGANDMIVFDAIGNPNDTQPVFASDRVGYYGQPVGLIVATSRGAAYAGRAAMQVTYDDIQPPVLSIEEALTQPLPPNQFPPVVIGDVAAGFAASTRIIEGSMKRGGQFHYHMETQVALVNPTDIGFDVHVASQWLAETQRSIAQVLGIADREVYVSCKRLGGAFGAKIDQCNMVATAAAVAAYKTRRPVRLQLSLGDNMTIIGGREPYLCTYKVGVDDAGVLQAVQVTMTADSGYLGIDVSSITASFAFLSCYSCPNWEITPLYVTTNHPITTWCRAPGTVEGITFVENMMDHVAAELSMDPLALRQLNLMPDGSTRPVSKQLLQLRSRMPTKALKDVPDKMTIPRNLISNMITQMLNDAEVATRSAEVVQFNQANLWKKRGLTVTPMSWPYYMPNVYPFSVLVAVSAHDGSVTITNGGAEMGQGLNTKVVQVAAYELGIAMDMFTILPTNTHSNANSSVTGGSLGSDVSAHSVGEACKKIKARLDAYKVEAGLVNPTWQELVSEAYSAGVDISERYVNAAGELQGYAVFGVACTEVELDVLTGQFLVKRTDILEDAGKPLNPVLDIGQVEGAFVMGQGLFTTEKVVFDSSTGQCLTDVWNYHPPYALDIPADLRVTLLQDAPNPIGVQSSKVTSEPPTCLAYSVMAALRQAVSSARQDAGTTGWFQMDAPLTTDYLQQLCLVDAARLTTA